MKRTYFFLVVLGIALLAGVWLASRSIGSAPAEPSRPGYRPDEIVANGIVEGTTPEIALRPEIVGTIRAIHFRENQDVKKDDVLFELENDVQKQQVAIAQAELSYAEAELDKIRNGERAEKRQALIAQAEARKAAYELAQKQWARAQILMQKGSISREEHDATAQKLQHTRNEWKAAEAERDLVQAPPRQDELDAALSRVAMAKAKLAMAHAELAKTLVRAPRDGRVLQVFVEPGDQAGPATGRPVLLLADVSKLRVRAFVEELDAPRVAVGQTAKVTIDGIPGRVLEGTVQLALSRMGKRAPHSDQPKEYHDIHYREVMIDLHGNPGLLLGLRTTVRIQP